MLSDCQETALKAPPWKVWEKALHEVTKEEENITQLKAVFQAALEEPWKIIPRPYFAYTDTEGQRG